MSDLKLGPAFAVSRVSMATKYGGTTWALRVHFHTREHAEKVRDLLVAEPLPTGPWPRQSYEQADLIDLDKLRGALVWYGCAPPDTREMLSWWVGREVNRLLDQVLEAKTATEARGARAQRLIAACEGELGGIAVDDATAERILRHVDGMGGTDGR